MTNVWITGASSGIGYALALALARNGATVIATARRAEELQKLSEEARGLPGRIHVEAGDITDAARMEVIVASVENAIGPIDIAVLNAGLYLPIAPASFDVGAFRKSVDVNLMGTVHGLAAVLPRMVARRRGRVAIMASLAGYGGLPSSAAYGATKAALINLAASLRIDLDGTGVIVQVINPGFVATPRNAGHALPMLMPVDEAVARIVAGLATDRFEIAFPRRLVFLLRALNLLPYRAYFALMRRAARSAARRSPSKAD